MDGFVRTENGEIVMSDLISRAAAIAEIEEFIEEYSELDPETGYHNLKWCAMEEAKDALKMLPTIDAVHVIRCKECKYWLRDEGYSQDRECRCGCNGGWWLPEEYCSCGERRDADGKDD